MFFFKNESSAVIVPKSTCKCECNTCDKKVQKANSSKDGGVTSAKSQVQLPGCSPK